MMDVACLLALLVEVCAFEATKERSLLQTGLDLPTQVTNVTHDKLRLQLGGRWQNTTRRLALKNILNLL